MFDYQYQKVFNLSNKKTQIVTDSFGGKADPYVHAPPVSSSVHNVYPIIAEKNSGKFAINPEELEKYAYSVEKDIPRDLLEKYKEVKPHGIFEANKNEYGEPYVRFFDDNVRRSSKVVSPYPQGNTLGKTLLYDRIIPTLFQPVSGRHTVKHKLAILKNFPQLLNRDEVAKHIKQKRSISDLFGLHSKDLLHHIIHHINKGLPGGPLYMSMDKFEEEGTPGLHPEVLNAFRALHKMAMEHKHALRV